MSPATTKTSPLNRLRFMEWLDTGIAVIIAILLAVAQYYSITQLFIRISLIIATYFLFSAIHKKFLRPTLFGSPQNPQEPTILRLFMQRCFPML